MYSSKLHLFSVRSLVLGVALALSVQTSAFGQSNWQWISAESGVPSSAGTSLPHEDELDSDPANSPLSLAKSIKYDVAAVTLASVVFGSITLHDTNSEFKFSSEGWFGADTTYGGMDKLGHAWYGATISDYYYERIRATNGHSQAAALAAAGLSFGAMALIEVADGFAKEPNGFSHEDLIADAFGAAFSYFRNTTPEMRDLVDFRMEYLPDNTLDDLGVGTFYSDQKYLLAWKLSGLNPFRNTPARFFELHTGYYSRGFSTLEKKSGISKERTGYVGLGVNLSELFFGHRKDSSRFVDASRLVFEHVQIPYTYVDADIR